ncbi:hypothetical protein AVEN_15689-1 [Araneus ventricosus]|uniref:Uncharacterized protein n=1 Tax=Araneus ventricosus TaxID=182803 RepID=A0A4Y2U5Y6_ARAVE|nr:hypothetical protein AVEN_15689-1 [Araneus ventricosus]
MNENPCTLIHKPGHVQFHRGGNGSKFRRKNAKAELFLNSLSIILVVKQSSVPSLNTMFRKMPVTEPPFCNILRLTKRIFLPPNSPSKTHCSDIVHYYVSTSF